MIAFSVDLENTEGLKNRFNWGNVRKAWRRQLCHTQERSGASIWQYMQNDGNLVCELQVEIQWYCGGILYTALLWVPRC